MRRIRRMLERGFTLVELMIVVAIVGVLAALAIYGVRKYIANSKTAEARQALGRMAKDAATAYNKEGMAAAVLAPLGVAGISNRLCGSTTTVVPPATVSIQGKKYQSSPGEWTTGTMHVGWTCVKFSMKDPQYYQYNYISTGTLGAIGDTFRTAARGDLNGDLTLSTFTLDAKIQKGATGGAEVMVAPNMDEILPEE